MEEEMEGRRFKATCADRYTTTGMFHNGLASLCASSASHTQRIGRFSVFIFFICFTPSRNSGNNSAIRIYSL